MLKYIIITAIIFLFIIHFLKYKKKKNSIDIIQIDHIIKDYKDYIDENYPIILTNHDSKSIEKLYSPLSISSSTEKTQIKDFCYHLHDMLIIIPIKKTNITICNPIENPKFKKKQKKSGINYLEIIDEKYNFIDINLNIDNFLIIPRFWIFKSNQEIILKTSDTIFSKTFKFLF